MAKHFRVEWNGPEIDRKYKEAARIGIDMTTASCVAPAKTNTPVVTGTAQGSIQFRPARIRRDRVSGLWGSFRVNYFIFLEIGARGRTGHLMLRRAADMMYPSLTANIRSARRRL